MLDWKSASDSPHGRWFADGMHNSKENIVYHLDKGEMDVCKMEASPTCLSVPPKKLWTGAENMNKFKLGLRATCMSTSLCKGRVRKFMLFKHAKCYVGY